MLTYLLLKIQFKSGAQQWYKVDFSKPSCKCVDWSQTRFPYKHILAVFALIDGWNWDRLPSSYVNDPLNTVDRKVLDNGIDNLKASNEIIPDKHDVNTLDITQNIDPEPAKVCEKKRGLELIQQNKRPTSVFNKRKLHPMRDNSNKKVKVNLLKSSNLSTKGIGRKRDYYKCRNRIGRKAEGYRTGWKVPVSVASKHISNKKKMKIEKASSGSQVKSRKNGTVKIPTQQYSFPELDETSRQNMAYSTFPPLHNSFVKFANKSNLQEEKTY